MALPGDQQPARSAVRRRRGDLADRGGEHAPLVGRLEHRFELLRRDDQQHPLLGLAGEDLVRVHGWLAQRDPLQPDPHAGAGRRGGLGQRAGQPGAAEVLDADDELGVVQLQARLDQQLLDERVTDLHRRAALLAALVEGRAGQYGDSADAVPAGLGAEQYDDVARPGGGLVLQPVDRQYTEAERVDQRVALVAGVEDHLATDVGQAQAVAVAADRRRPRRAAPGRCPGGPRRRTAAGPSPRPVGRPSPGCPGRCRRLRSPHPGTAQRSWGGCATRP